METEQTNRKTRLENTYQLQLSQNDFNQIMKLLEYPKKPTPALLKAVQQKYG